MLLNSELDLNDTGSVMNRVSEVYQYIFSKHFDLNAFGEAENMFYRRKMQKTLLQSDNGKQTQRNSRSREKQENLIQKSLIHSVAEHGFVREREQILDLLVKVEKQKAAKAGRYHPVEAEYNVVEKIKSGIPSSVGLAEALESLSSRFPWTRTKMIVMFIISFVTNIVFGSGFYVADIVTDVLFSRDMFKQRR